MKIAVPVADSNLRFFGNAGHTPFFAVYTLKGGGMFKSFQFEELRKNPRTDIDHDHAEEEHQCSHDHHDEEHVKQHLKMGDVLQDCDAIVVKKACKNTAKAMAEHGVAIKKYTGEPAKADAVLASISSELG